MPEFLSDEWIADLALACRAQVPATAQDRLVIEPVVSGVPGRGEVRYRVVFAGDAVAVAPVDPLRGDDPAAAADVRLETDYVTAVALARGTANAQAALADGRLRVAGDVARMAAHGAALAQLTDLFAAVRASTTYPAPGPAGA